MEPRACVSRRLDPLAYLALTLHSRRDARRRAAALDHGSEPGTMCALLDSTRSAADVRAGFFDRLTKSKQRGAVWRIVGYVWSSACTCSRLPVYRQQVVFSSLLMGTSCASRALSRRHRRADAVRCCSQPCTLPVIHLFQRRLDSACRTPGMGTSRTDSAFWSTSTTMQSTM